MAMYSRCSSVAAKSGRRCRKEPPNAAVTYLRACARCNCVPAPDISEDLAAHGTLVIDLRLCSAESLAAICALLRDAPAGISQVVLRDGLTSFGSDAAYRERIAAHRRRPQTGALGVAPLRLLVTALSTFLTVRGSHLAVLDLAGAPLGREINSLLAPLTRTLRDCRARGLRWLGLSGCRIADAGLTLLLPLLAGRDTRLTSLEALTLAWNHLADVRLIQTVLRARARMCFEHRAAPLQLLDLSGNPRLGDSIPNLSSTRSSSSRSRGSKAVPRLGACERPRGRRGALVKAVSCAITEGLPLRVVRLQHMCLDGESLQPFLQLMQAETQHCLASDGALAGASGFCMEELDLRGNDLEPTLADQIHESLQLLQVFRDGVLGQELQARKSRLGTAPEGAFQHQQQHQEQPHRWRRARSESSLDSVAMMVEKDIPETVCVRDAMSDGEVSVEGQLEHNSQSSRKNAFASREAFLFQRSQDRRRFHKDASALSKRQSRRPQPAAVDEAGLASWAEAPLAIAGVLGPTAAQSAVRQAVFAELCNGMPTVSNSQTCDSVQDGCKMHARPQHVASRAESEVRTIPTPVRSERQRKASTSSVSSSDAEVDSETRIVRDNRLDQLRAAVMGALADPLDSFPADGYSESRDSPIMFARGGLEEQKLQDMRLNVLTENYLPTTVSYDGLLDAKLDDMHREALGELCRSHRLPQSRLPNRAWE